MNVRKDSIPKVNMIIILSGLLEVCKKETI